VPAATEDDERVHASQHDGRCRCKPPWAATRVLCPPTKNSFIDCLNHFSTAGTRLDRVSRRCGSLSKNSFCFGLKQGKKSCTQKSRLRGATPNKTVPV